MTLIAAMCCEDGVVIAADSMATEASTGNMLIDQSFEVEKLNLLGTHIVWGAAGAGGLTGRTAGAFEADYRGSAGAYNKAAPEVEIKCRKIIAKIVQDELGMLPTKDLAVAAQAGMLPNNQFLFAGVIQGRPWIAEMLAFGGPPLTSYTSQGFHALGSGGVSAITAYKFLEHHGVRSSTLEAISLVLFRIMDTCVKSAAGGIGPPIVMFEITEKGSRRLPAPEMEALSDTLDLWENQERECLRGVFTKSGNGAASLGEQF